MSFDRRPRAPVASKPKSPRPLSVGCHAFVDRPPSLTQKLGAVVLTDEKETQTLRALTDGQEVEILAWRQRPSVQYRVRCLSGDAEGWLAADCLRTSRDPLPEAAAGNVPAPAAASLEERRTRSVAPARRTAVLAGRPRTSPAAVEPARSDLPVPCPVCGNEVHPYNLSRNTKGAVVGCFLCHGKPS